MKMHKRSGSIFWLVIGIYTAIHASQLGLGHFRQPGPGFIFFLTSLLLIVLSAIDLSGTFIRKTETDKDKKDESIWLGVRWQNVLFVLTGISIYIFIFSFLGFLLSTFLLMIFLYKAVEPTKWWIATVESLITILAAHGIFGLWLKVPFPQGALGF